MHATMSEVDQAKLEQVLGQTVTDLGAALNGVLMMVGGELGLWQAMAGCASGSPRRPPAAT